MVVRKYYAALLVTMMLGIAQPVSAESYNGNKLLRNCKADVGSTPWGVCIGYVTSVSNTTSSWQNWGDLKSNICLPAGFTSGQLIEVAVKYLEAHPLQLHLSASSLVLNAYIEAFPCEE
jgi:hypothetical protein